MIQQIEKLKEIINQNSMGHLPLPYRVDLMKQIGDTRTVQKVLCECCKKHVPAFRRNLEQKACYTISYRKWTVICTRIKELPKAYWSQ